MTTNPVLVVDDDAVSRHVLCQALGAAELPYVAVSSGADALKKIEELKPSLVLLDLIMPQPDGYQVLRILRSRAETREIPVVVLTALDADAEVARAFESGADDFVRKPFRPVELIARIRGQLRLRRAMETVERKEHDARVILEVTQALASNLDFRNILFGVTQRIAEVSNADRVSIVLVRESGEVGYVVAASDDEQLRDQPIELTKYPEIREALQRGEPLVISDAATYPLLDVVRRDPRARVFNSVAILPIVYESKAMGVLFLRARPSSIFGERELALCRTIASAMAIALRNARIMQSLRDETQQVTVARFEAERRLKSLERYADFFESSADGIVVFDSVGTVLFANPLAREISGYAHGELRGRSLAELFGPSEAHRAVSLRDGFARGEFPRGLDVQIVKKSGELLVLSLSFSSVMREESVVLCSFRDVTRERAIASELVKTKNFLERIVDSSADAIVCADHRGRILIFNRAAERIYGAGGLDILGADVRLMYLKGDAERVMRLMRAGDGRVDGLRIELVNVKGERVPVSLSASTLYDGTTPVGSVGVLTDLREKMMMEQRLQDAQDQLIAQERQAVLAELAGAAAHELNQPLTSVLMSAELLKRKLEPATPTHGIATVIHLEAERMAEIVRKIGKITKYETKSYVGRAKILDLDKSAGEPQEATAEFGEGQTSKRKDAPVDERGQRRE